METYLKIVWKKWTTMRHFHIETSWRKHEMMGTSKNDGNIYRTRSGKLSTHASIIVQEYTYGQICDRMERLTGHDNKVNARKQRWDFGQV